MICTLVWSLWCLSPSFPSSQQCQPIVNTSSQDHWAWDLGKSEFLGLWYCLHMIVIEEEAWKGNFVLVSHNINRNWLSWLSLHIPVKLINISCFHFCHVNHDSEYLPTLWTLNCELVCIKLLCSWVNIYIATYNYSSLWWNKHVGASSSGCFQPINASQLENTSL